MHGAALPGIEKRKKHKHAFLACWYLQQVLGELLSNWAEARAAAQSIKGALTQSTTQLPGSLKTNSKKSCSSCACVWAAPFCAAVSSWVYKKGKQAGGASSVSSGNLMNAPRVPHVLLIRCITTRSRFESASKS